MTFPKKILAKLKSSSGLGKSVKIKKLRPQNNDHKKKEVIGKVVDEVSILCRDKKFLYQKIKPDQNCIWAKGEFLYRYCYYSITKGGDKVVWGQFASILLESQIRNLNKKAIAKGWKIS